MSRRWWSGDKLSNEELTLILIRLPLYSIYRCKFVSKRWFALISDPYFIRHYNHSHKNTTHYDHFIIHTNPFFDFISLPHPHQLPKTIFNFSLNFISIPRDFNDSLYNGFNILATSYGFLLCNSDEIFFIRNPLTREFLELPPAIPHSASHVIGFVCYPMDPISSKLHFKVLVITRICTFYDYFETDLFDSKTGKWKMHEVKCPPGYKGYQLYWGEQHALICNDIFHWRSHNNRYIIAYDPVNQPRDCKPISFPVHSSLFPTTVHHMEVSDRGHIRIISSQRHCGFFDVWELTDYDNQVWNMKYQVQNPNDFTITNTNAFFSPTNAEIVYLIHSSTKKLIVHNMKNGSPEHILDLPLDFGEGDSRGRAMAFVATPWPIPIPQLPILQIDQDM